MRQLAIALDAMLVILAQFKTKPLLVQRTSKKTFKTSLLPIHPSHRVFLILRHLQLVSVLAETAPPFPISQKKPRASQALVALQAQEVEALIEVEDVAVAVDEVVAGH